MVARSVGHVETVLQRVNERGRGIKHNEVQVIRKRSTATNEVRAAVAENAVARFDSLNPDGTANVTLQSALMGREPGFRLKVSLREQKLVRAGSASRPEFSDLVANGLQPGGFIDLQRVQEVEDTPSIISIYRAEMLTTGADGAAEVETDALISLRPAEGLPSGSYEFIHILRQEGIIVEGVEKALNDMVAILQDPDIPGRAGFVMRVIDNEEGSVAAKACLPKIGESAEDALSRFITQGSREVMQKLRKRKKGAWDAELVPVSIMATHPDKKSRMAAQMANFKFIGEDGEPRFAESSFVLQADKRGRQHVVYANPVLTVPTMVGWDFPAEFEDRLRFF